MSRPMILAVEDDATQASIVRILCKKFSCEVVLAETGAEAITLFAERADFDVVLMDVRLPDMDGMECARALREVQTDKTVRIPIVALTAHAMRGDREKFLESGMDDYLSKPYSTQQFQQMLQKWIPGKVIAEKVKS